MIKINISQKPSIPNGLLDLQQRKITQLHCDRSRACEQALHLGNIVRSHALERRSLFSRFARRSKWVASPQASCLSTFCTLKFSLPRHPGRQLLTNSTTKVGAHRKINKDREDTQERADLGCERKIYQE